jgi:Na+-translocating ferredoxin:NAD+ oxidoreductase RnfC subunit
MRRNTVPYRLHCVDICPAHRSVHDRGALRSGADQEPADFAACIECGLCSFVCPSGIPLLHAIRTLKKKAGIS